MRPRIVPLASLCLALAAVGLSRPAQAERPSCGPVCSVPGRVILCNDSLQPGGPANFGAMTDPPEAVCGTFTATPYPVTIRHVYVLLGPPDMTVPVQWDLEVYEESMMPMPGPRTATMAEVNRQLIGDPFNFQDIDIESFGSAFQVSAPFRVCLKEQFSVPHNVGIDADGMQGRNWVLSPTLGGWLDFASLCQLLNPSLCADFIIRPEVQTTDLSPWQAGGVCQGGPPPDAGVNVDAGPQPDGGPVPDAGVAADSGGAPQDTGVADAGGADTGGPIADGGVGADTGGVPATTPSITAISPNEGPNNAPTDVIITGANFVAGATAKIGSFSATDVEVRGSTTIAAVVPANIAPGEYDVIVENPGGLADILDDAYTVFDPNAPGPGAGEDDGGCGCSAVEAGRRRRRGGLAWFALTVVGGFLLRRRRRRR